MTLADHAAIHLHMGARVRHNSATPPGCIAALDPVAALERDIGVAEGTNTTTSKSCAVGDCALLQYSPRALQDGEPTWVRKEQERMGAAVAASTPRVGSCEGAGKRQACGPCGATAGDREGLNMRMLPPMPSE